MRRPICRDASVTRARLAAYGLTPARTHLLWELFHREPCTQRVLADALGASARNVTGLIDGVEQSGHAKREPHPGDRRATMVTLTDQGTDAMTRMQKGQEEFARLLFADLPDRQQAQLTQGLAHVLDRLRELVSKGEAVTLPYRWPGTVKHALFFELKPGTSSASLWLRRDDLRVRRRRRRPRP